MTKKLYEIAADIVQNQVSTSHMSSDEIVTSLRRIYNALHTIQKSESDGTAIEDTKPLEEAAPQEEPLVKIDPKESIQDDKIICLECGAEMRQLTAKHLFSHNLSPREYKKKYGFSLKQPLSARSLTKARSKAAKKRGIPENLAKYIEGKRQKKTEQETPQFAPQSIPEVMPAPVVLEEQEMEKNTPKRSRKKKAAAAAE